ncbi:DUF3221 domain-containing protein [Aquibacillus kalidii]|uniref:DUF3221 domain-containing protein n=1 Tax=Aquibacillus kalidii TaxID=2762597 RepID=UPI001647419C|nr:DUF3221 domain-containing protein [Aquibacillus kalidii]
MNLLRSLFVFMGILIPITGCSEETLKNDEIKDSVEIVGIISYIKSNHSIGSAVLVIPDVTKEDIANNSKLGTLARLNNGSWFLVDEVEIDRFVVGQQVKVTFEREQYVMQGSPPYQDSEKIEIIQE